MLQQSAMTLLKRDADVNAIDSNGDTPIHLAVKVDIRAPH